MRDFLDIFACSIGALVGFLVLLALAWADWLPHTTSGWLGGAIVLTGAAIGGAIGCWDAGR